MVKTAGFGVFPLSLIPLLFGYEGGIVAVWALSCFATGIALLFIGDRLQRLQSAPSSTAQSASKPWSSLVFNSIAAIFLGIVATQFAVEWTSPPNDRPAGLLSSSVLPGLQPTDVYLSFTRTGFSLEKDLGPEQSVWRCIDQNSTRKMLVEVFGDNATTVSMVRASYNDYGTGNIDQDASQFFGFAASVPYSRSSPSDARLWVERNLGNPAITTIGGVSFELTAVSDNSRMLIILP